MTINKKELASNDNLTPSLTNPTPPDLPEGQNINPKEERYLLTDESSRALVSRKTTDMYAEITGNKVMPKPSNIINVANHTKNKTIPIYVMLTKPEDTDITGFNFDYSTLRLLEAAASYMASGSNVVSLKALYNATNGNNENDYVSPTAQKEFLAELNKLKKQEIRINFTQQAIYRNKKSPQLNNSDKNYIYRGSLISFNLLTHKNRKGTDETVLEILSIPLYSYAVAVHHLIKIPENALNLKQIYNSQTPKRLEKLPYSNSFKPVKRTSKQLLDVHRYIMQRITDITFFHNTHARIRLDAIANVAYQKKYNDLTRHQKQRLRLWAKQSLNAFVIQNRITNYRIEENKIKLENPKKI